MAVSFCQDADRKQDNYEKRKEPGYGKLSKQQQSGEKHGHFLCRYLKQGRALASAFSRLDYMIPSHGDSFDTVKFTFATQVEVESMVSAPLSIQMNGRGLNDPEVTFAFDKIHNREEVETLVDVFAD